MKKFFKEHSWLLYLIIFLLMVLGIAGVYLFAICDAFRKLWKFSNENIWLLILNILSFPFAILGGFNIFRGWIMVMKEDGEKLGFYKNWHVLIYTFITFISCIAFVYWITQTS